MTNIMLSPGESGWYVEPGFEKPFVDLPDS